uniref:Pentraxin (PTX) domain-containing protein n=1 Tax=Naja naja TaxID=35670 RepID=A0A8C6VR91_NAJNA
MHWTLLCFIFSPLLIASEHGLPKFICSPMPLDMDNGCQVGTLEEAKETILHLRETVVHQKEMILDQRETVRELTAKLSRCETHSRRHSEHHGTHQEENHNHKHGHHEGGHRGHHDNGQRGHHEDAHQSHHEDGHRGHRDHNWNSSIFSTSMWDTLQEKITLLEHQIHEKSNTSEHQTHSIPKAKGMRQRHVSHGHTMETKPDLPDKYSEHFHVDFPLRTNYMYIKIKHTLQREIFAFSICLWLKSISSPGIGTPFSYSVPNQANEVVLIQWGNNPMELLINDKVATLPLAVNDAKWHHICVTWSTRHGIWKSYQDGVQRGSGENLAPWHPVKPGGVFILGQEQDTLGGRFDATQAFIGEMSDFNMWSYIVTPAEIYKMATCSSSIGGDLINWTENSIELHRGVIKLPYNACH